VLDMKRSWIASIVLLLAAVSTACLGSDDDASSLGTTVTVGATASPTVLPEPGSDEADPPDETTIADDALAGSVDACELVTSTDAERILGAAASVDPDSIGGFGETSACSWVTDADALLFVSLFEGTQFYGGPLADSDELTFGDDGHVSVEPNFGGTELQVVEGDWVLSLSAAPIGVVDADALPDAMLAVAEQALDRLP
jgi:hypothetical protein